MIGTAKDPLEPLDKVQIDVLEIHTNLCEMMELMLRLAPGNVADADEIFRAFDNMVAVAATATNHAKQVLEAHSLLREGKRRMSAARELSKKFFEDELGMTMELPDP